MKILGISAGFHDAAATLIDNEQILWAGHAERYSMKKHDETLNDAMMADMSNYGYPDVIAYYERPWVKKLREIRAGQKDWYDWSQLSFKENLHKLSMFKEYDKIYYYNHHLSHAAAGFQTSPFNEATVVVIDAIGELDTISIWHAEYDKKGYAKYKKLWGKKYPHSIGLFYSAATKFVGLKPLDEEYILMGMSAYGNRLSVNWLKDTVFLYDSFNITFRDNFHAGFPFDEWPKEVGDYPVTNMDIAAAVQSITEELINRVMYIAQKRGKSKNLVYMGGVALNCLANRNLGVYFDNIWIMPNPGDAGSSLGCAALKYGKQLDWQGPYLGTNISSPYPVDALLHELVENKIVGVANGRAEFGPRALGNRSLLADPRGNDIKDKVNAIKRRQKFRPFAPVILEEHVHDYFDMPVNWARSDYMQVVANCKNTLEFPAIVHVDGTSRVQTVPKNCKSGIRQLLEKWYTLSGCPMLLNTSLNIRGEPIVNTRADADRFESLYGIKVLS